LSIREKLQTLEPFVPVYNYITASIMVIAGERKTAIPILEALPVDQPRNTVLAHAYAAEGRYGEAANTLLAIKGGNRDRASVVEEAARLIRSAPTKVKAPESLPTWDQELSFVYLYAGAPDRVLDYQERLTARYPNLGSAQVDICGLPTTPRYARRSASGPSCARWVSSIIGVRAAGPISAIRSAQTISSASEA
jgi:hypothetical protein